MANSAVDDMTTTATPPSAISVFSNLISTSPSTPHSTPAIGLACNMVTRPSPTGPHSLPTEILCMIFHFVFESCISSTDDPHLASWLDQDPLSPSLFPYALACVCRRWCRTLKPIPVYWTRVVIALDAIAASLTAARTTLGRAGDAPLKIVVTRHRGTSETRDSERAAIGRAIELLRPHVGHIWSLSFDIEYSSSITPLWQESSCAPLLKVLKLLSRADVGRVSPPLTWVQNHENRDMRKLKAPLLQDVTLNGHLFKKVIAHPRLVSWFRRLTSLTICGNAASAMSLYKFIYVINIFRSIRELTIEDVHFDDNAPYPHILPLRPAVLCFRRVTGRTALRNMLTHTHSGDRPRTDVTIVDCTIHGFNEPGPESSLQFSCTNLTLASMDPSAAIEDLVCRWNGKRLSVIDCPQMSRSFLEQLSGDTAPMFLSHLDIADCDNVHAGDVIALVQSRETQAASASLMDVSDDDAFTAFASLHVRGRGPPISAKRAEWLAEHVETFSWDTVAKDGMRYVWDGSSGKLMTSPAGGCSEVGVGRL